ncbi:hypothetical protein ACFFQW_35955 [Umezawaea endophytica]|uniref:Uncharacterized protein n=1 Tax=Umezawaea endophytica TaxID=1654476 RepID=A0A9X2VJF6_9PSEU|nr:hypothetical protein [Umezawaea endophytica]MCS7477499.1 hypothetical protein [Umezawaea endophytica]
MKDKAMMRLGLAELMKSDPRPVWEVVLDHVHALDAIAREARVDLREGEDVSAEQLDRIVDSSKAALTAAKLAIDTRSYEMMAEQTRRNVELEGKVVAEAIGRVLDVLLNDLRGGVHYLQGTRTWAFESAHAVLLHLDANESAVDLELPPSPLAGFTLVSPERLELLAAQTSSTADDSASRSRQPVSDTSTREDDSDPEGDGPAPTSGAESTPEPLEAELVEETPTPGPRRSWSPRGMPSAWRQGGSPFSQAIG